MLTPTAKHEAIKEKLLSHIAELPPGTKLPSVKNIINRYGVSQATVDRALKYLKENGYVKAVVGKGIYTADRAQRNGELGYRGVDLIAFGNPQMLTDNRFNSDQVKQIGEQLGERGCWFRSTLLPHTATANDVVAKIDELNPEALILLTTFNSDVYDAVYRRALPFVLLFPNCPMELSNSVLIDNRQVAKHWVDHLVELGHRKIAYINMGVETYFVRDLFQRQMFFYEELAKAGVMPDPDLVVSPLSEGKDSDWAVHELVRRGKEFSAIICGDPEAPLVYQALLKEGLTPGKDVSVIGVDDCAWAEHMQPPLTTVRIPRRRLAKLAIQKLEDSLESHNRITPVTLIGSDLVVRKSTGSPAC